MNISCLLNVFQKSDNQTQEPKSSFCTGRLWTNYTNKINSIKPTSFSVVNTTLKIAAYMATVPFVVIATPFALVADAVKFSFDSTASALTKLRNKLTKEEEVQAPTCSNAKKIAIASVSTAAIAASAYALRFYEVI